MALRANVRRTDNSKLGRAVLNSKALQSRHEENRLAVSQQPPDKPKGPVAPKPAPKKKVSKKSTESK